MFKNSEGGLGRRAVEEKKNVEEKTLNQWSKRAGWREEKRIRGQGGTFSSVRKGGIGGVD